jgi:hypothetical protein
MILWWIKSYTLSIKLQGYLLQKCDFKKCTPLSFIYLEYAVESRPEGKYQYLPSKNVYLKWHIVHLPHFTIIWEGSIGPIYTCFAAVSQGCNLIHTPTPPPLCRSGPPSPLLIYIPLLPLAWHLHWPFTYLLDLFWCGLCVGLWGYLWRSGAKVTIHMFTFMFAWTSNVTVKCIYWIHEFIWLIQACKEMGSLVLSKSVQTVSCTWLTIFYNTIFDKVWLKHQHWSVLMTKLLFSLHPVQRVCENEIMSTYCLEPIPALSIWVIKQSSSSIIYLTNSLLCRICVLLVLFQTIWLV